MEFVWFLFWWCCPLLSEDYFHKLGLSGTPSQNSQWVQILGIEWPRILSLTQNESVPWKVMFEVFKCSVWESVLVVPYFSNRTLEYLRYKFPWNRLIRIKPTTPSRPIPKITTHLTIFWGGTWKTKFEKTILRQERTASEEKSDESHRKCSKELGKVKLYYIDHSNTINTRHWNDSKLHLNIKGTKILFDNFIEAIWIERF